MLLLYHPLLLLFIGISGSRERRIHVGLILRARLATREYGCGMFVLQPFVLALCERARSLACRARVTAFFSRSSPINHCNLVPRVSLPPLKSLCSRSGKIKKTLLVIKIKTNHLKSNFLFDCVDFMVGMSVAVCVVVLANIMFLDADNC